MDIFTQIASGMGTLISKFVFQVPCREVDDNSFYIELGDYGC